ncbi:MAG: GNAT family N-acetyltransferase [Pseudomonadota bacterium]
MTFVRGLSVSARYFRFGDGDYDPLRDSALHDCLLKPEQGVHLVAVSLQGVNEVVVGSARYVIQPDGGSCEFGIVVADSWSHHGVGHRLMTALLECAREQGLASMYGRILASNLDMLAFVAGCGFDIGNSPEGAWVKIARIGLQRTPSARHT